MAAPSNNLWIGNLCKDATDVTLMEVFAKYGALDAASYSSRGFGFVYFKHAEDAKLARDALQGTVVDGNPIKIDFGRPARPSNHLWVGGLSSSISKEELEEEFMKYGKVDDFTFLRDRGTAFVQFSKMEDAAQAMKTMNGKRIGNAQIRVDYLRSKKEPLPDFRGSREAQFQSRTMGHFDTPVDSRIHQHPQLGGWKGDGQPSNILRVGYPHLVEIDEGMLHNAFILFGEIERIKSFPQRHQSFVEFRSVDEARRAKEGLQGRLFGDPRITIMYSSSDIAPSKDYPAFYPEIKGPRPDMVLKDNPFLSREPNILGHNRAAGPNNFHRHLPPNGIVGANTPSIVPSPPPGSRRPGGRDGFDANQFQRDPKRSRIDSSLSINGTSFPSKKVDELRMGMDHPYGIGPLSDGGGADPYAAHQGKSRLGPMGPTGTAGGRVDYIWRGIIAKGGTSVCLARCVPVGKGIASELPQIVNCSARTGLDMLAKHYADAIGFEICYFLPDREDDFASYTELLRYLGGNNRAGVAKLDDGTTLFLVPPSDFLTKVLKVSGPERLYGVVLKLPQLSGNEPSDQHTHQSVPSSRYADMHHISPRGEYGQDLQMDYNRFSHVESTPPPRPSLPPTSGVVSAQPISQGYASNSTAISQAGIGLTPELIASLATLVPTNTQNPVSGASQQALGSSTQKPQFLNDVPDDGGASQVWKHDQQQYNRTGHLSQQSENLYNAQAPPPRPSLQYDPFAPYSHSASHSINTAPGNTQAQNSVNPPHHGAVSVRPLANFTTPPSLNGQHYQYDDPHNNAQGGYGAVHGANATLYGSSGFQTNNRVPPFNQVHGSSSIGQPQADMALANNVNVEIPSQVQHFQDTSEVEVDKNERYQSTLQFAANLLVQIQQQQQQQQTSSPAGGSRHHQ